LGVLDGVHPRGGGGLGLVGMCERAQIVGGRIEPANVLRVDTRPVAALGSCHPARRAARVDPAQTLRADG